MPHTEKLLDILMKFRIGGGFAVYGDHSHLYIHGPISAVKLFNGFSWN
jgi:hypothetical protein